VNCPRCGDDNHYSDRFCSTCGLDLATYRNLWPQPPLSDSGGTLETAPAQTPAGYVPPATQAPVADPPDLPSYLGWAAALVALCWPAFWAGIPALVYAGRVESHLASGDISAARQASEKARNWCWVTFLAGLLLWAVALAVLALV